MKNLTPEQRAAVNRRNARQSSGPRTAEGKDRSRSNALRHGLRSESLIPSGADRVAIEEREQTWNAYYRPQSPAARHLVQECVRATVLSDRVARYQSAALSEQTRDRWRDWHDQRADEVLEHAGDLRADPADACQRLRESAMGCRWLLERWERLLRRLDESGQFSTNDAAEAVRLLGCAGDDRGFKNNPSAWKMRLYVLLLKPQPQRSDVRLARMLHPTRLPDVLWGVVRLDALPDYIDVLRPLKRLIGEEIAALRELAGRLLVEEEHPSRVEAAARALLPADLNRGRLQLRYDSEARGAFHRGFAALVKTLDRDALDRERSESGAETSPNEAEFALDDSAPRGGSDMGHGLGLGLVFRVQGKAEEPFDGEADVEGAHQGLADEDRVDAGGFEAFDVAPGADAALTDEGDVGRDAVAEPEGEVEVGDEPGQIAVVDADEGRAGVEDAGQIGLVVELDKDGHSEPPGALSKRDELAVVKDFGDQEDGVGPREPGLDDLVLVDDEILPQERHGDRRSGARQVGELALEEGGVGEDAQAVGAVCLVDSGDGDRVEIGADDPGGRARLLHLRDQADRPRPGERVQEVPHRRGLGRLVLQFLDRQPLPRNGDLAAFRGDDLVENRVGHGGASLNCRTDAVAFIS